MLGAMVTWKKVSLQPSVGAAQEDGEQSLPLPLRLLWKEDSFELKDHTLPHDLKAHKSWVVVEIALNPSIWEEEAGGSL